MKLNLIEQIEKSLSQKPYRGAIEGVRPLRKGKTGKRMVRPENCRHFLW